MNENSKKILKRLILILISKVLYKMTLMKNSKVMLKNIKKNKSL